MNRELNSGETEAPKTHSAAQPAVATLSRAAEGRRANSVRERDERTVESGAKLKST